MRTVRFVLVGGGLMGKEFAATIASWSRMADPAAHVELVAVYDTSSAVRSWFSERFPSVKIVDAFEELTALDFDIAYVAVPHVLHESLYCSIIESGRGLFAEKPYGIDLKAANAIEAARANHPESFVRVSSEFPFYPAALSLFQAVTNGECGRILEVRAGFLHCSDLDPTKPINWKRQAKTNGEYGCMGDLGLHALHLPLRLGWKPKNVRAILSNIVAERPDANGRMVACDTWDNATLLCDTGEFPMKLDIKRISPGNRNTWYLEVDADEVSLQFSTSNSQILRRCQRPPSGKTPIWESFQVGHRSAYPTITGEIFEFGFTDAIMQMWAACVDEFVNGDKMRGPLGCARPSEALFSHKAFTAALESNRSGETIDIHD